MKKTCWKVYKQTYDNVDQNRRNKTVIKKAMFVRLQFRGDVAGEIIIHSLSRTTQ